MSEYAQRYLDRFSAALIADSAFRAGAALEVASPGLTVIDPAVMVAGPSPGPNDELQRASEAPRRRDLSERSEPRAERLPQVHRCIATPGSPLFGELAG